MSIRDDLMAWGEELWPCTCHDAYTSRGRIDPECSWHNEARDTLDELSTSDWLDKHDAEVAATERARIINHLSSSPMVTIAGKGGALEWLRKEAA